MYTATLAMIFVSSVMATLAEFKCNDFAKIFEMPLLNCLMEKPIGRGNFGSVHVVEHAGQLYAAKASFYPPDSSSEKKAFLNSEPEIIKAVGSHPNVIKLFKSVVNNSGVFLLMEYGIGGNLQDFIFKQKGLAGQPYLVLKLVQGIAAGIKAVHDAGYAIADLKPNNIVLTENLEPKIIDFGLSHKVGEPYTHVCGSLAYLDPDRLNLLHSPKPRSGQPLYKKYLDVYSLGSLMFFMLSPNDQLFGFKGTKEFLGHACTNPYIIPKGTQTDIAEIISRARLFSVHDRIRIKAILKQVETALTKSTLTIIGGREEVILPTIQKTNSIIPMKKENKMDEERELYEKTLEIHRKACADLRGKIGKEFEKRNIFLSETGPNLVCFDEAPKRLLGLAGKIKTSLPAAKVEERAPQTSTGMPRANFARHVWGVLLFVLLAAYATVWGIWTRIGSTVLTNGKFCSPLDTGVEESPKKDGVGVPIQARSVVAPN